MNGILKKIKKSLWWEKWNIAVGVRGKGLLSEGKVDWDSFSWPFDEPREGFFADPFLIENKGKLFVFFEQADSAGKGKIVYAELQRIGREFKLRGDVKTAIEKDFHLSYPFIFERNGEIFMLPESADANEIALYKAIDFPHRWAKIKTLIPGFAGVDPTIFEYQDYFWIFCTKKGAGESHNSDLYAFYAQNLLGPWEKHAGNPIKKDITSARPAGSFFIENEKLFRTSQSSKETYGEAVRVNKVLKLSPTEFEEEEVFEIKPFNKEYPEGIHTVSLMKDFIAVDSKRFSFIKKLFYPMIKFIKGK